MDIKIIQNYVSKARRIIETNLKVFILKQPAVFEAFPKGTCGVTSEIIGTWLISKGIEGVEYVNGKRWRKGRHETHGWLEIDGLIIDITSDQFKPDGLGPVYIGSDRKFHDTFQNQQHKMPNLSFVSSDVYPSFLELMRHFETDLQEPK
jgi:hypothetical protein